MPNLNSAVKVAGLKQSSKSLLKDKYSRNTEGFSVFIENTKLGNRLKCFERKQTL